jgi:hypothetical protein
LPAARIAAGSVVHADRGDRHRAIPKAINNTARHALGLLACNPQRLGMERVVLVWVRQAPASRVRVSDAALEVLVVLLGSRLGCVADGSLFGDSRLEDAAEVSHAQ